MAGKARFNEPDERLILEVFDLFPNSARDGQGEEPFYILVYPT